MHDSWGLIWFAVDRVVFHACIWFSVVMQGITTLQFIDSLTTAWTLACPFRELCLEKSVLLLISFQILKDSVGYSWCNVSGQRRIVH